MSPRAEPFVTETLEYNGDRQVTVYVPPDPAEVVVFAGDVGWHMSRLGGALDAATARSTIVVGVHGLPDDDGRLKEYVPGFDENRFVAHERFFVEDVRRWVQRCFGVALPAQRTAVWGASLGGELALAMGLRHPDTYGAVFSASPGGGLKPPAVMPNPLPREYLVAVPRSSSSSSMRFGGPPRCAMQGRRCDDRAGRAARRGVLGRGVPADGGLAL